MDPAKIQIDRVSNVWVDRGRAYEVLVNGTPRERIRRGEQIDIEVDLGPQDIQIAINWCRSPTLTIDVKPGGRYRLRCRPANPLLVPYLITFERNRYISLETI